MIVGLKTSRRTRGLAWTRDKKNEKHSIVKVSIIKVIKLVESRLLGEVMRMHIHSFRSYYIRVISDHMMYVSNIF